MKLIFISVLNLFLILCLTGCTSRSNNVNAEAVTTDTTKVVDSGPSACDCANILENRTRENDRLLEEAGKGNGEFNPRNEYWGALAVACMKKYTTLAGWEIESVQSMGQLIADEAITKAQKECSQTKTYSIEQKNAACDCWEQSYAKSKMEFDSMTPEQQKIRNKCFELFKDEDEMKAACENK